MALFDRLRTPATAAAAAPTPQPSAGADEAQLAIGAGLALHLGEPLHAGSVKLDGSLSGQLHLHQFMLGRSGQLRGAVHCHSAQLRGDFDGELVVQGRLTVFASADLRGRVRCNDIVVWKGANVTAELLGLNEPLPLPQPQPQPQRRRGHLALLSTATG